jgi:hypothetical protein
VLRDGSALTYHFDYQNGVLRLVKGDFLLVCPVRDTGPWQIVRWGGGSSHQGFDPFRGNLASCRDAGVVARAFPMSRRQDALSLTHHAEVASLKPDPADELLRWAKEPIATQEWLDIAKLAS